MPTNYVAALNATQYFAQIDIYYPLNTPVFNIRVILSTTSYLDLSMTLSQTGIISDLFEYDGGSDDRIGIEPSDLVPVDDYYVFDTSIVLVSDPTVVFTEDEYPIELDIEVSVVGLLTLTQAIQVTSQATGYIVYAPGISY